MSVSLGQELAQLQIYLAEEWNSSGPDAVAEILEGLEPATVTNLLMANIGSTASKLS